MALLSPAELQVKIEKLQTNMERLNSIINGNASTDVAIDSGTVPTIQKLYASISQSFYSATPVPVFYDENAWGDSLTLGYLAPVDEDWPHLMELELTPAPNAPVGVTGSVTNHGVAGEKSSQIVTRFLASSSDEKLKDQNFWMGTNDVQAPRFTSDETLANFAAAIADLDHTRYTNMPPINGEGGGRFSFAWCRHVAWRMDKLYRGKFIDIWPVIINARVGTADDPYIAIDRLPPSLTDDGLHINGDGTRIVKDVKIAVKRARYGGAPYVAHQYNLVTGNPAADQTIGAVTAIGSPSNYTLESHTDIFQIDSFGQVSVVAPNLLVEPYYDLRVRAYGPTGASQVGIARWYCGDNQLASPKKIRLSGSSWMFQCDPFTGVSNAKTLSFAIQCQPTTDGEALNMITSENGRIIVQRTSGNAWDIALKNNVGTPVFYLRFKQNGGGAVNSALGIHWFTFSCDLAAGTYKAYINGLACDVTVFTAPVNDNIDLVDRLCIGAGVDAASPFKGILQSLWWLPGAYIDFSALGNRNAFFNSGTLAAVTLGTNGLAGSATPKLYLKGKVGDWLYGRNFAADQVMHTVYWPTYGITSDVP